LPAASTVAKQTASAVVGSPGNHQKRALALIACCIICNV
jgi:hypothetical protein